MIERASVFAAGELRSDSALRGLDRAHFIDRLAYHYDQVNYIHPFREGNGRVQRVFWNRIAVAAGWQLDWRPVHGDVNDHASRAASDQRDLGPLRAMFDQIVTPAPPVRNRGRTWREAQRQRMSFTKRKPTCSLAPDPALGERVCAVVVARPGRTFDVKQAREHSG